MADIFESCEIKPYLQYIIFYRSNIECVRSCVALMSLKKTTQWKDDMRNVFGPVSSVVSDPLNV